MSPPDLPDARRSRAWLWALLPIALGVLLLVGGAVVGAIYAVRGDASPPKTGVALPAPAAKAVPGGGSRLAPPDIDEPPTAATSEAALPAIPMPSSPAGERARALEASALLPLSPSRAIWGTAEAPVTLAVFGDLACPFTRAELRISARLAQRFGSHLRIAFYHRPLDDKPEAERAAVVLAAVAAQAGVDAAFRVLSAAAASDEAPGTEELGRWLRKAGVETSLGALSGDRAAFDAVRADRLLALKLDVQATPTVYVNGARVPATHSEAELEQLIEREARSVRWLVAQGTPPEQAYVRRVRKNLIGVGDGADSRACVPIDAAPVQGPDSALVSVVEFSDFDCERCRALEPVLAAAVARHRDVVRRVWRSFAPAQRPHAARVAAVALTTRELAGDGAFWKLHADLLSDVTEEELSDEQLRVVLNKLGVDGDALLERADSAQRDALDADRQLAESLDVESAPTLFINGRRVPGTLSPAELEGVLREEIDAARRLVKQGTPSERFETLLCAG